MIFLLDGIVLDSCTFLFFIIFLAEVIGFIFHFFLIFHKTSRIGKTVRPRNAYSLYFSTYVVEHLKSFKIILLQNRWCFLLLGWASLFVWVWRQGVVCSYQLFTNLSKLFLQGLYSLSLWSLKSWFHHLCN